MPPCDQCCGIEKMFSEELATRELRDYRKSGAPKSTRVLIDAIQQMGVQGAQVMDIGGGVGAIQQKLFQAGAAHAISVDASTGYTHAAEQFAREEGYAERVTRIHGDFTKLAPTLERADFVTLDRVLCCFDDMPGLVSASAAKADRAWGAVYPRDFGILRGLMVVVRAVLALVRFPMRFYIHRSAEVAALLRDQGLIEQYHKNVGIWQVVVYERTAS
jgi:hypothetical protein